MHRFNKIVTGAWINNMPVDFAVAEVRRECTGRPFDRRLIETIYHMLDVDFDVFFNYEGEE